MSISAVYFDGNSLTQSRGNPGEPLVPPYPSLIDLTSTPSANVAVGGATTPQQDARATTAIDTYPYPGNRWVVMWEGSNDLYFGATAAQAIANLGTYCTNRRAAGFSVALLSLTPRFDVGLPLTFEPNRQIVNQWLRANWATIADAFVDVGADPCMGHAGQQFDERFYLLDRVHLNLAGAQTIAGYVAAALENL